MDKTFGKIDNAKLARWATLFIVALGWVGFEAFNLTTTINAVYNLFGETSILLVGMFVIGLFGLDFGGLMRMTLVEFNQKKISTTSYILFGVWLVSATMNAILTWWDLAITMDAEHMAAPAGITARTISMVFPLTIAIIVWLVRVSLTIMFGQSLGGAISASKPISSRAAYNPILAGAGMQGPALATAGRAAKAQSRYNGHSNGQRGE